MMPKLSRYNEETDEETEIDFEFDYTPESRKYFDKSFGNWLPGDQEDFEVTSATDEDGNEVELTDKEMEMAYEAAMDHLKSKAEGDAEARHESMMDDREYFGR